MKIRHILYSVGVLLGGAAMVASVGALSAQRETDFYFTFNPTIGLSLSSSELVIGDLVPGNAAKSNEIVLTINSNNATGYQLLATVGNDSEYNTTGLINGSLAFASTSGAGVANLTSLADNTWGYTMDTDGKYYGLPLYNATPKVLFSTSTPANITKTFAIGAKAASTQASGEYKNVINFELVGNVSGNPTITIQAGTGGIVAAAPTAESGKIPVKLWTVVNTGKTNSFTLIDDADTTRTITATANPGYAFSRWTTTCGATVSEDCTITAEFKSVPRCEGQNKMQDIDTLKNTLFATAEQQVQLCDARDGKMYWAAKLADGNIWMTQNLDLELDSSVALTNELTDLNSKTSWTPNRSTQDHQYKTASGTIDTDGVWNGNYNTVDHSYRPASDVAAGTSGDYGNDGDTYYAPVYMKNGTTMQSWKAETDCTGAGNSASDCQHWNVGTFYSWRAATAGSGDGSVSTVTNVSDSICPKGWHLPTSTSTGEFQNLVTKGGITASNITGAPYYFLRSGRYLGDYGAVYNTGNDGYYWSSTSNSDTSYAYYLDFSSGNVDPSYRNDRCNGMSVRCVAGS